MLTTLIITLIVVNGAGLALLYLQHRQAAREREAGARMAVEIYNAAHAAVIKCAEIGESAVAARAQLEQDHLEALKVIAALRLRSLTEDFRGAARS